MNAPVLTGQAGDTRNDLQWSAVPGAVKYRLQRKFVVLGPSSWSKVYEGSARVFAHLNLVNGSTYQYRVKALGANKTSSPYSPVLTLTPQAVVVPPPTGLQVYGYGAPAYEALWAKVKGLSPIAVSSWGGLAAAINTSGPRLIRVSGTFSGGGAALTISKPDCWIEFAHTAAIHSGWFKIAASRVVMLNPRIWLGDDVAAPDDADPITINGGGTTPDGIAIIGGSLLFGPDIGGLAILNGARNITVQGCILGAGLFRSRHSEASRPGGHSKGVNVTQIGAAVSNDSTPRGDRISFIRNVLTTSDDRMPQLHGGSNQDWYENVIYNPGTPPHGNPRSLNFERNTIIAGPQTPNGTPLFASDTNRSNPSLHPGSVYLAGNVWVGMSPERLGAGVRVSTRFPHGPLPLNPWTHNDVLAAVGPSARHPFEVELLAHVAARTSEGWYNGSAGPEPRWVKP